MKAIAIFIFSLGIASLHAAFEVPKGVFTAAQMQDAQAKAAEENKPLVFVLTDSGST